MAFFLSLPQLLSLLLLFHEFISLHYDYQIPTFGHDLHVFEHTISVLFFFDKKMHICFKSKDNRNEDVLEGLWLDA